MNNYCHSLSVIWSFMVRLKVALLSVVRKWAEFHSILGNIEHVEQPPPPLNVTRNDFYFSSNSKVWTLTFATFCAFFIFLTFLNFFKHF